MALAGAIVMGRTIGEYIKEKPVAIAGHNIPWVVVGALLLGFGWLGSTLVRLWLGTCRRRNIRLRHLWAPGTSPDSAPAQSPASTGAAVGGVAHIAINIKMGP